MKPIFRFFAQHSLLASILTLAIILLGLNTLHTIHRDVYPYVDLGQQVIVTEFPGASPEDVELKITNPIEKELKTVSGIEYFTSVSAENVSIIRIFGGVDKSDEQLKDIKREVREAVRRVHELPSEVTNLPKILDIDVTSIPFLEVGIVGSGSYGERRELARLIERKLENIAGVKNIERLGWRAREVRVEVDSQKLTSYQIPLQEIVDSIVTRNIRGSGGSFESYTSDRNIVTLAQFREPEEVGEVIVRGGFDSPLIRIRDLAVVKDTFADPLELGRSNGEGGIILRLFKESDADVLRLVEAVEQTIEEERSYLEEDTSIVISKDASRAVRLKMEKVQANGLLGFLLVFAVLAVTLNFKTALWVSISIPVVLLGAFAFLPAFGLGIDSLMLTAMILVLGIVIDDSIIVSESIYRNFEKGLSPIDAVVKGLSDVFYPVVITMLTTIIAFSPMFFMTGMMGRFVFVVPLTIILTLSVSLVEVTCILPAHLASSLNPRTAKRAGGTKIGVFRYLEYYYAGALIRILRFRYLVVLAFLSVFVLVCTLGVQRLGFELFPVTAADKLYLKVEAPAGTSLEATQAYVARLEQYIFELPANELSSITSHIGLKSHDQEAPIAGENFAILFITLTPFEERERSALDILADVRGRIQPLADELDFELAVESDGPPIGKPISLTVVGANDQERRAAITQIEDFLVSTPGVFDIKRNDGTGKDELQVELDYAKLARLELTAAEVAQTIRLAYDGQEVSSVRYGEDDVSFRVLFEESFRKNPDVLNMLQIPNHRGRLIRLDQVAAFHSAPGPQEVHHYNGIRAVRLTAEVAPGVSPNEILTTLFSELELQSTYRTVQFVVSGEVEETRKSVRGQLIALGLSLLGIYLLLVVFFNSVSQPLVVMCAVPIGAVGVVLAFLTHNAAFGFAAMLGAVGLVGVVVNDALILVNRLNVLQREGQTPGVLSVVALGSADRLRPIILTTITTVAGILPLAYGVGGSDPFMGPMALSMGYGLLFGTLLTLLLVPCLYVIEDDIRRLTRKSPAQR